MWNTFFLWTAALTAGLILLAYIGAEVAYRNHEQSRQNPHQQSGK